MSEEQYPLNGQCTCGKVKYELTNKPLIVHCCHCTWCQRESGASFALNAFIETECVKLLESQTETIDTPTNSGGGQKIVRCKTCKIAIWSHYSGAGDVISLFRIGTLEIPNSLKPDIHIFTSTKQDWVKLSDDVPSVEEYYQRKDYWLPEHIVRLNNVTGK